MSELNGKPQPDINSLTPNDLRRLRVKLGGRSPQELLTGELEDVFQTLILAYKLRDDPGFTWDQAGEVAPAEVFDMTGGDAGPPPTPPPEPPGSSGGPPARRSSTKTPSSSATGPSSAASSA